MNDTRFVNQLIDAVYQLPNQFRSIDEYHRTHHADLSVLSDDELDREAYLVNLRINLEDPSADHWVRARLRAIFNERHRRGWRANR
jgi:hypothetical protein